MRIKQSNFTDIEPEPQAVSEQTTQIASHKQIVLQKIALSLVVTEYVVALTTATLTKQQSLDNDHESPQRQ